MKHIFDEESLIHFPMKRMLIYLHESYEQNVLIQSKYDFSLFLSKTQNLQKKQFS